MTKAQHMTGVFVSERVGPRGTTYGARYTLRDGSRRLVKAPRGGWAGYAEAYDAGCDAQRKENRSSDVRGGQRTTVNQLIDEFYLPEHTRDAPTTRRSRESHLGDGTGAAKALGRKNTLAAKVSLRYVFGHYTMEELNRQLIVDWQEEMLAAGTYKASSIKAKRDLLKAILQIAVLNGWLPVNYVDSVKAPKGVELDEAGLEPEQWALLRSRLNGEVTRLFVETTLETGTRKGESSGLRAMDVVSPSDKEPTPYLHIRQKVIWLGVKEVAAERVKRNLPIDPQPKRYMIDDYLKMGKPGRRIAISMPLYQRLVAQIERFDLLPEDLLFDYGILRAEQHVALDLDPLPTEFPSGRFVNASGRSGEHGKQNTYSYGCRCPFCTRAYSEYRFWWARKRGRKAASPWLDDGFLEARAGNTTPIDPSWFDRAVWKRATGELGFAWTLHDLRHAMVTWAVEANVPLHVIQRDAGHSSMATTEGYKRRLEGAKVRTERSDAMAALMAEAQRDAAPPRPAAVAVAPDASVVDAAVAAVLASHLPPAEKAAIVRELMTPATSTHLRVVSD